MSASAATSAAPAAPPVRRPAVGARRPPASVRILTALFAFLAAVVPVGALQFAFPLGGLLGPAVGTLLVAAGASYAVLAWRLRRGGRGVWAAALALPVAHTLGLNTLDLARRGAIASEDYPFMGVAVAIVLLLLLPATRRFVARPPGARPSR